MRTTLFCAALCCLVGMGKPIEAASPKPPNIVLIISDDQCWTDFGFMGHPVIQTPNLDRLAREGVLFRRGYVPDSLCRPSLATIITGLYPHQHKLVGNDPARPPGTTIFSARKDPKYLQLCEKMIHHIEEVPTLPRLLASKGYISLQTGKWWEGHYSRGGFTEGMTHGDPKRGGRHGDNGLKIGRKGMQPIYDFIDKAGDRPFFILYAPFLPHAPHTPSERLLKKYQAPGRPAALARYYAMCEWFDETCGQLLNYLDKKGLAENTLVIFVVDNGWIQRTPETKVPEHWKFHFAPKSKRSPYDGGLRTPIIVRWKGHLKPRECDIPVSSVDIAPTVLAAAGVAPPQHPKLPGVNLIKVAESGCRCDREAVFGEVFAHDVADINDPTASLLYRWCVTKQWKLIVPADSSKPVELYEIVTDPFEKQNVADQHPDVVKRLKKLIDQWWPATSPTAQK